MKPSPEQISKTNAIALYIRNGQWYAQQFGPKAAEVQDLFGTTVLPTPFGSAVPAEEVLETIQGLNPQHTVYLTPETADWPQGSRRSDPDCI